MAHSTGHGGSASQPKHVLVTGATGNQGGHLARSLLQRGHHVRALSRKPNGLAAIELKNLGIEVVPGDLGDRTSVELASQGIDTAFLVATPYEKGAEAEAGFGINALNAFKAAGVPHVVYSSVADANRRTGIPHFDSKAKIEEHLQGLGVPYSIVAPVFFSENILSPWLATGLAKGVFATGVLPQTKIQVISVDEIADFTTHVIENPGGFRGKRVDIASDELRLTELTEVLSGALQRPIVYQAVPLDAIRQQSEDLAKMYDWFNRVGYSVDIPKLKREYPQVAWGTFREWAARQDWAKVTSGTMKS